MHQISDRVPHAGTASAGWSGSNVKATTLSGGITNNGVMTWLPGNPTYDSGAGGGQNPWGFAGNLFNTGTILTAVVSPPATDRTDKTVYGETNTFDATATQVRAAANSTGVVQTGAGLTVGVISDSFNALGGAASDEQNGALPAASDIDVLRDYPGSDGGDEGRAMMQIVHDIAPAAKLDFYTGFFSEAQMAEGILALAAAGCKVVCDDIGYLYEPLFQNGILDQAIQAVEQQGVIYASAAGNYAENGYQAAWTPIASTNFDGTTLTDTQDFGGGTPYETLTLGSGGSVAIVIQWNQPFGDATSNLKVLVFKNGSLFGTATSTTITGGLIKDDTEPNNPLVDFDLPADATYQIAIENLSGPDPGMVGEVIWTADDPTAALNVANAGTTQGHPSSPDAIGVGAVDAGNAPNNGGTLQNEPFSSSGLNAKLYFNYDGTTVAGAPVSLNPVAISGVDDIKTTVTTGGLGDFFGTSAATPSVAAIIALMLQENPALTFAEVETELEASAIPFGDSAVAGAGLVNAAAAVQAAGQAPVAGAGHNGAVAYTNAGTTASLTIGSGSFAGNVGNIGKITSDGITVVNSTISGQIFDSGYLHGGIGLDAPTHLTNPTAAAIAITGTTFFGNISNGGSISAPIASGIAIHGISTFDGGINNTGSISAAIGIAAGPDPTFTGFVLNGSSGIIAATRTGIAIDNITSFFGGIENSGELTAPIAINIANNGAFEGVVNNNGGNITATTAIRIADSTIAGSIYVNGTVNASLHGISIDSASKITDGQSSTAVIDVNTSTFMGGIVNAGTITAATKSGGAINIQNVRRFAGDLINTGTIAAGGGTAVSLSFVTTFLGAISNTGTISGSLGIMFHGTARVSVFDAGTIIGSGGTAIAFAAGPNTLTLAPGYTISGKVTGGGNDILQLGGSSNGAFNLSAIGTQYTFFSSFAVTGGDWTVSGSGPAQWSVSAGTMEAASGARLSNTMVANGALLAVLGGGSASSTVVSSGGEELIGSGGTSLAAQVKGGGGEVVFGIDTGASLSGTQYDFGVALGGTTLANGFQQVALAGAVASGMTIEFGGEQYVGSGGTTLAAQVGGGGAEVVFGIDSGASLSGTQYDFGNATGGTTYNNGYQLVAPGAVASGMTVMSGGVQYIGAGGTAVATDIAAQGAQEVFGSALETLVSGTQYDFAYASGGTIHDDSFQVVAPSATAIAMTVKGGGQQYIGAGGTSLATDIASQGAEVIFGTDSGARVSGTQYVFGVASGGTTLDGGSQQVQFGGTAIGMTVSSRGLANVGGGGTAIGTDIMSQGAEIVHGTDLNATISGTEYVYGLASGSVVGTGGYQLVSAGGTISAATISGGTIELMGGASDGSAPISFTGTGQLILDASTSFSGTVAGFGSASLNDTIDFADIPYVATGSAGATSVNWTAGNGSGTLSVSEGGQSADITLLGQYAVGNFTPSNDGHGGTLVTDPPLSLATDPAPNPLLAARHA